MAIKNDVGVFYFACIVNMHVLFMEDGQMDKRVFLETWKDIPAENEVPFVIFNVNNLSPGEIIFCLNWVS